LKDSSIGWNVRPKDLRHFFASTMLNRGANPMEIANQMGHADVQMLIERYGKYSVAKLHEASKVWDRVEEGVQMVCKQEDW
jgi:integrase